MAPRKERRYQLVEAFSPAELERKVHSQIHAGEWVCQGGVCVTPNSSGGMVMVYYQALVDPSLVAGFTL